MVAIARYEKGIIVIYLRSEYGETYFGRRKHSCMVVDGSWRWWRGCEVLDQNLPERQNMLAMTTGGGMVTNVQYIGEFKRSN